MRFPLRRYFLGLLLFAGLVVLLSPLFLVMRTLIGGASNLGEVDGEDRLTDLREQLEQANVLHRTYKSELVALKDQLQIFLRMQQAGSLNRNSSLLNNISWPSLTDNIATPNAGLLYYLPHLATMPDALIPSVKLSSSRRADLSFVIGIPTIKREEASYLTETLRSLLSGLSDDDSQDVLLVIMVGEQNDATYVDSVVALVKENFPEAVSSGIIEVIAPKSYYYPDLTRLPPTFGDPPERLQWRAKQVLDFVFLMHYCRTRGTYFMQLEDDVVSKANYIGEIRKFMGEQHSEEWLVLEFSALGFIGKLFRTADLYPIVHFFLMFYRDKPVDWLLDGYLTTKACNPEKDDKHCNHEKESLRRRCKPSLFQHVGMKSSLKGKIQKLRDKEFGKPQLFIPHENPPAIVSTTLKEYQDFRLDLAYGGTTHFWALLPQANDTITFEFTPPVRLEKYYIRSGNAEHIDDRFYDTAVEMKFEGGTGELEPALLKSNAWVVLPDGFVAVGAFDSSGIAQGNVSVSVPVGICRLRVLKESQFWVVLSEIHFKMART